MLRVVVVSCGCVLLYVVCWWSSFSHVDHVCLLVTVCCVSYAGAGVCLCWFVLWSCLWLASLLFVVVRCVCCRCLRVGFCLLCFVPVYCCSSLTFGVVACWLLLGVLMFGTC